MTAGSPLAGLDTCAVSDALTKLGIESVLTGITRLSGDQRIAGRAVTVELGPPAGESTSSHLATSAIVSSAVGDVIVIAHQNRTECAGWGGNLSRAAQHQGISGAIVHGAVRDVDEARELGFPVFATAVTPRTARGRAVEKSWGQPICIGEVTVRTGDWIVADASGVVAVPSERVDEVVAIAAEIVTLEQRIAAAIADGVPVTQAMGAPYEHGVDR